MARFELINKRLRELVISSNRAYCRMWTLEGDSPVSNTTDGDMASMMAKDAGTGVEDMFAALDRQMAQSSAEIDLEAEMKARDEDLTTIENSEDKTTSPLNGLPSLAPVEWEIMRGLGEEGPHRVFIPEWYDTGRVDEDDERIWKLRVIKKKIGPFKLRYQMDATEAINDTHDDTQKAALAWSYQKGEGDIAAESVVELLERVYPKSFTNPETGIEIKRPPFTPEMVTIMFNGQIRDLTQDNIDALVLVVTYALQTFNPEINEEWVVDHCDYGMLVRIFGKILYINGGMRDRFLP